MSQSFATRWLPTVAMVLLVILFVRLGLWQHHKAEAKQSLQTQMEQRLRQPAIALTETIRDAEAWRYRRVQLSGRYDARYQILLDNQVHRQTAGYHVITPLQVPGSATRILVDRGWIPALPDHATAPAVATPQMPQTVTGYLWLPPSRHFALAEPPPGWQPVWQNLDMQRYARSVPFAVQPLVLRLDSQSEGGGFARDWPQPAERMEMHLSYAYQWYGFALTLVAIYVVLGFRKAGKNK